MSNKDLRQNQNTVWEEAGGEFYQENYNKSSGHRPNPGTMARISLPSHTARRNSGWKTTTYTHRQSTTCGNEYIIDGIPDLADESLPNEKSTFEQLESFKGTPVPMAEKRGLKTQLITNPILKLNGWGGLKWRTEKSFTNFCRIRKYFNYTLFRGHLRSIENRFGFVFTTYFQDIKTLLFLNLLTILPFLTYYLYNQLSGVNKFFNYDDIIAITNSTSIDVFTMTWDNVTDLVVNSKSFIYYGYYETSGGLLLLLVGTYFGLTLLYYFTQIWKCLKDKIESKHVKHVYSDLIFCRMDNFTKCKTGAEFKRGAIQKEIRCFVQNVIIEGNESNRLGLIGIRTCVNLIVVGLISICVAFISHIQDFSRNFNFAESKLDPIEIFVYFLPQIFICLAWPTMSFFVERMGKWEKYTYDTRIFILVLRCWIIRLIFLGGFVLKFYKMFYANSEPQGPLIIMKTNPTSVVQDAQTLSMPECWESSFAKEIYKFLIVDMILKIFVIFMVEPIRALIRRLFPYFGGVHFHIVWNYLDVLTTQTLSWLGIYFTPVLPIVICVYTFFLFFLKTFSLLANCSGSPDLYRPIRTLMVKVKLFTFFIAILVMVYVFGWMKPSTDCGPFKDYGTPWEFLIFTVRENIKTDFVSYVKCPQWSFPLLIIFLCLAIYYKFVIKDGEKMIQTLRHLLVLEGHDKQWLFQQISYQRRGKNDTNTSRTSET